MWALKGMGIKAVIAPYFGDIFNNNCFQNGILPVPLPIEEIEQLADEMKASPGNARVTVDLENCPVDVADRPHHPLPGRCAAPARHAERPRRHRAQTMSAEDEIEAWQTSDKSRASLGLAVDA